MLWERVEERIEYWGEYPPVHLLVRGAVGYKPQTPGRAGGSGENLAELAAKFGGQAVKRGE